MTKPAENDRNNLTAIHTLRIDGLQDGLTKLSTDVARSFGEVAQSFKLVGEQIAGTRKIPWTLIFGLVATAAAIGTAAGTMLLAYVDRVNMRQQFEIDQLSARVYQHEYARGVSDESHRLEQKGSQ